MVLTMILAVIKTLQKEELEGHHIDNMMEKIGDYILSSSVNVIQYSPFFWKQILTIKHNCLRN